MKKKTTRAVRPRALLDDVARAAGCHLSSIGDVEQLAGINIKSNAERTALWQEFRHLYSGDTQVLIDAVMDKCSAIAIERIKRGELCLIESYPRARKKAA